MGEWIWEEMVRGIKTFKIQAMKFLRINKIVLKTGVGSRYVSACLQSQHREGRARQLSVKASQGYIVRSGFITQTATKARHCRKHLSWKS